MWNLKNKTINKHNKTEAELEIQRTNWWLPEERIVMGRKETGEGDEEVQTSSCKINES